MDGQPELSDATSVLLSRLITETADNTAAVLTLLDFQARAVAHLEGRSSDEVVDEVSEVLKRRRRAALQELDAWTDSIASSLRRGARRD